MKFMKDLPAYITLLVTVASSIFGFNYLQPNEGQARYRGDHVTVNAAALQHWGVDPGELRQWGFPVELTDEADADVVFKIGRTSSQEVPGFGTLYVAGESQQTMNSRRWFTTCTITLNDRKVPALRDATAIAVHEFGHCLGVEHDDTRDSIMGTVMPSKKFTPEHWSWTVTDADRAVLDRLYG